MTHIIHATTTQNLLSTRIWKDQWVKNW